MELRTAGVTGVSNLDLGDITRDAVSRGVISPSWYLIDVEAGFELWRGGAGLSTRSFSFEPNGTTSTTSAWRANVVQSGSAVTATSMSYNGVIEPGGTQTFGIQGVWTGSNPLPVVTCST